MFAYILLFILLVPLTFLSSAVESFFSPEELNEMGIRLGNPQGSEPVSSVNG